MSTCGDIKSNSRNFSTREWWMTIGIIVLIEAGIFMGSFAVMGDVEVINFFSFASAIASLILAVLAIVYGFYQSESQKRAGEGISEHLLKIHDATENMTMVSRDLTNNSKEVALLGKSLPALNETISVTKNMLDRLDENVSNISKEQTRVFSAIFGKNQYQSSSPRMTGGADFVMRAAENVVLNGPNIAMRYTVLGLNIVFKDKEDDIFSRVDFVESLAEILASNHPTKASTGEWSAAIYTAVMVLRSVGLLRGNSLKVDSSDTPKLALAPGMYELTSRLAQETTSANDEYQPLFRKLKDALVGVPFKE